MVNRSCIAAGIAALIAGSVTVAARQSPEDGLAVFERRVAAYVEIHRRVAATLPRNGDAAALAAALRAARPRAGAGDVFVPAAAWTIRAQVLNAVARNAADSDILQRAAAERRSGIRAIVNERFPGNAGRMLPPFMLGVLPPLPAELEYRLAGGDLVLLDVDADLVVDVLGTVLPGAGS
jgi:hypothetical protein